ncbi:hypothetical protein B0H19DRAFT_1077931 [Mycena capillaripes]|nr:hypothetical protein B0H19DRAFT_1077931 [Mycena capillaripes]
MSCRKASDHWPDSSLPLSETAPCASLCLSGAFGYLEDATYEISDFVAVIETHLDPRIPIGKQPIRARTWRYSDQLQTWKEAMDLDEDFLPRTLVLLRGSLPGSNTVLETALDFATPRSFCSFSNPHPPPGGTRELHHEIVARIKRLVTGPATWEEHSSTERKVSFSTSWSDPAMLCWVKLLGYSPASDTLCFIMWRTAIEHYGQPEKVATKEETQAPVEDVQGDMEEIIGSPSAEVTPDSVASHWRPVVEMSDTRVLTRDIHISPGCLNPAVTARLEHDASVFRTPLHVQMVLLPCSLRDISFKLMIYVTMRDTAFGRDSFADTFRPVPGYTLRANEAMLFSYRLSVTADPILRLSFFKISAVRAVPHIYSTSISCAGYMADLRLRVLDVRHPRDVHDRADSEWDPEMARSVAVPNMHLGQEGWRSVHLSPMSGAVANLRHPVIE